MEANLQESADWFKLMNEILNVKGNIILCEVSRAFHFSDIRQAQGTNEHLHCCPISEKKDTRLVSK